jgi:hypothetical protein
MPEKERFVGELCRVCSPGEMGAVSRVWLGTVCTCMATSSKHWVLGTAARVLAWCAAVLSSCACCQ